MEVHRQRCQKCDSLDVRLILTRGTQRPACVFVRCARCQEFVARYELSSYYHSGRGVESWARNSTMVPNESGRALLDAFERVESDAKQEFEEALLQLERDGKLDE